jgi:DNA-binding MarR family transcriptional regulator
MSKRIPSLEGRLGYRLRRLVAVFRASMQAALRTTGISPPQYTTMVALSTHPGSSNATLARICFVTPQTMNEIIQGLELASLVERVEADTDRREIALQLTDEGRRRMAAGYKQILDLEAAALAPIAEGERGSFLEHLDVVAATLEAGQEDEKRASRKPVAGSYKRRAR